MAPPHAVTPQSPQSGRLGKPWPGPTTPRGGSVNHPATQRGRPASATHTPPRRNRRPLGGVRGSGPTRRLKTRSAPNGRAWSVLCRHKDVPGARAQGTSGKDTAGMDDEYAKDYFANIRAGIMGAGKFGLHNHPDDRNWKGWRGDKPPFNCPVFVCTRRGFQRDGWRHHVPLPRGGPG